MTTSAQCIQEVGLMRRGYIYYHATPTKNVSRILSVGLKKAKDTGVYTWSLEAREGMHPESGRIYVALQPRGAMAVAKEAGSITDDWTILRIKSSSRAKHDPDFWLDGYGYLTKNIPPKNISVLGRFKLGTEETMALFRKYPSREQYQGATIPYEREIQ